MLGATADQASTVTDYGDEGRDCDMEACHQSNWTEIIISFLASILM